MPAPYPFTRVPDVVDALVTLFRDATDLQTLDGPHLGEVMNHAICVGLSSDQSRPGYDVEVTRQDGLGRPRYLEAWTVSSVLSLTSGDSDVAALRTAAADALGKIDTALRALRTNGDVWQRAGFGARMEWLPVLHPQGATVNVFFDIVGESVL